MRVLFDRTVKRDRVRMNQLELIEELLDGKFELPCSEITLTRESGSPIEVSGPGFIRINSDNKFDVTIHIPPQDYQKLFMFPLLNMTAPGTAFSGDHHFQLVAKSYLNGTWNGRVLMPTAGGTVGQAGLTHGTLSELRFEEEAEEELEFDFAKLFVAWVLNFPALCHRAT
jgi:hypothetical protein